MFGYPLSLLNLAVRLFFILAVLQLGACGLNLGGPQSVAVKYVRGLVEQPDNSPELAQAYSTLPNRVAIEYARALHKQGIAQKYRAEKLETTGDSVTRIAVTIIPERKNYIIKEREHILIVGMQYSEKEGWKVIDIKTQQ